METKTKIVRKKILEKVELFKKERKYGK